MLEVPLSPPISPDSDEKHIPALPDKRKRRRKRLLQTPNLNSNPTNPNNEGFVGTKKAKTSSDENSTELKKDAKNFDVEKAVCWKKEESVPFLFIANALDELSKESDPIVVTRILCNMLRTVIKTTPNDLAAVVYLLSENQRIVPPRDIQFGFGHEEIKIAIAEACKTRTLCIERDLKELGDLGLVAKFWRTNALIRKHNQANPLTVVKVLEAFNFFAEMYPTVVKKDLLRELLETTTGCEPLYLIYLLQRMLQVGAQKIVLTEENLLTALGHAALYSEYSTGYDVDPLELENAANAVKQVYSHYPAYDKIVTHLRFVGVQKLLDTCTITPMLPEHTIGSIRSPSVSKPNDSIENQTPKLNTNPNSEGFASAKICSDENSTELKKKAKNFDVEKAVCWGKEQSVPFLFMANALDEMLKESDPIVVTEILCNMLRTVIKTTPKDLAAVVYLLSESILPAHVHQEYDIYFGTKEIEIAIAEACKTRTEFIVEDYKKLGDLGLVAKVRLTNALLPTHNQANPLTVVKVFETFQKFAKIYPTVVKKDLLRELLEAATGCEPLHLIYLLQRIIHGARRIVLAEETLLTALGHAALYSENSTGNDVDPLELENAAKVVKQVYSRCPAYDKIVPDLLSVGVRKLLDTCTIAPGIPFKAMLPEHTIGSIPEIFVKFQAKEFTCEYEYPGKRAMIHYWKNGNNGSVEVYWWNGYQITGEYDDVGFEVFEAARLKEPSVESFIIDCQLVAYDRDNKKVIPSETRDMLRAIDSKPKVEVCVFAFDILHHNGEQLLQKPLKYRREVLLQSFEEKPGFFEFAHYSDSKKHEDILKFVEEGAEYSCQRLIIKTLTEDATYEPDISSENWLKLEMGYVEYIPPILRLVPIAAFRSRTICSIGDGEYNFVLACYDDKSKEYKYMCDIDDGWLPKEILEEHFKRLNSGVTSKEQKEYYKYHKTRIPEEYTWFEPTEVWEVKVAGLYSDSTCPVEFGSGNPIEFGSGNPIEFGSVKGIGLVAPYLVGVLGEIGPLNQPTSADEVVELYKASKHTHSMDIDPDEVE